MATVFLLYEGDEWLSRDSMILMGVFSDMNHLKDAAQELICQRAEEHASFARDNFDYPDDATRNDVIDDIMEELFSHRNTCRWTTNYSFVEVELDKLEEV